MSNNERYKRLTPHVDNANEIISAKDINELQDRIQANQESLFVQRDVDFRDKALFVLTHHALMNSLFVEEIDTPARVDIPLSSGFVFTKEGSQLTIEEGESKAVIVFKPWQNKNSTQIAKVLFMWDGSKPSGTSISFEISNNGVNWFVVPNTEDVFSVPGNGTQIFIRVTMLRPNGYETPTLNAFAVLYEDPTYSIELGDNMPPIGDDGNLGLIRHSELLDIGPDDHHPQKHAHDGTDGSGLIEHKHIAGIGPDDHHAKNHRHGQDGVDPVHLETDVIGTLPMESLSHIVYTGLPGQMQIGRNPRAEDKVVHIIGPDEETFLFYDWSNGGRLRRNLTIRNAVAVIEDLIYGPYTNGAGVVETKVMGTEKSIVDATDSMVNSAMHEVFLPKPEEEVI